MTMILKVLTFADLLRSPAWAGVSESLGAWTGGGAEGTVGGVAEREGSAAVDMMAKV